MKNLFSKDELRTHSLRGTQSNANVGRHEVLPPLPEERIIWIESNSLIYFINDIIIEVE